METDLFTWESLDIIDEMSFQYYDCTLETRIGEFEAGEKIPTIAMNYDSAILQLLNKNGEVLSTHTLKLVIQ